LSGSPSPTCHDKALQLLARRPHFRRQLERKLLDRGYGEDQVAATLERLAAEGYLDDERLAREFAAARAGRAGEGARRVRAELERRGVAGDTVTGALADTLPADDADAAAAAAAKWLRSHRPEAAALARHLDRKGFSRRGILRVLREMGQASPIADSEE
jgi:regulatory protein